MFGTEGVYDLGTGMERDLIGVLGWWLGGRDNKVKELVLHGVVHKGAEVKRDSEWVVGGGRERRWWTRHVLYGRKIGIDSRSSEHERRTSSNFAFPPEVTFTGWTPSSPETGSKKRRKVWCGWTPFPSSSRTWKVTFSTSVGPRERGVAGL